MRGLASEQSLQFVALCFDVSTFRALFFTVFKNKLNRTQNRSPARCFRQSFDTHVFIERAGFAVCFGRGRRATAHFVRQTQIYFHP